MNNIVNESGRLVVKVDINEEIADELTKRAARFGISLADYTRKAFALLEVAKDHIDKGGKIVWVEPDGTSGELRQL